MSLRHTYNNRYIANYSHTVGEYSCDHTGGSIITAVDYDYSLVEEDTESKGAGHFAKLK